MVISILYETPDVLVVDKPAGALSVPSRWGIKDARPCVHIQLSQSRQEKLWPVHRLDEEVSGLLIFARNADAHRRLSKAFESREAKKTYEAWTTPLGQEGAPPHFPQPPGQALRWENMVVRGKKRTFEAPHGKLAVTEAVVLGKTTFRGIDVTCWDLHPLTGRAHQLRFHLSKAGHACLGDGLYGSPKDFFPGAIALRHVRLEIPGFPQWVATGLEAWVQKTITS